MSQVQQSTHIELRSGVRGERAFIAGHRVRVQDVVLWNEEGLSADEIVTRVPSITLADVHAALVYYYDHREEVDQQIRSDDEYSTSVEEAKLPPAKRQP
jgi:uncharacterized protein (DUF433 family)